MVFILILFLLYVPIDSVQYGEITETNSVAPTATVEELSWSFASWLPDRFYPAGLDFGDQRVHGNSNRGFTRVQFPVPVQVKDVVQSFVFVRNLAFIHPL